MNAEKLLRKMVKERRSRVEMAKALGITTDTLRTRLADLGIEIRKHRTLDEIVRAWRKAGGPDDRGACSAAAAALGLTRQCVHWRLRKEGYLKQEPAA